MSFSTNKAFNPHEFGRKVCKSECTKNSRNSITITLKNILKAI